MITPAVSEFYMFHLSEENKVKYSFTPLYILSEAWQLCVLNDIIFCLNFLKFSSGNTTRRNYFNFISDIQRKPYSILCNLFLLLVNFQVGNVSNNRY